MFNWINDSLFDIGVNDTDEFDLVVSSAGWAGKYLGKFMVICAIILGCESVSQGEMFYGEKTEFKNLVTLSLYWTQGAKGSQPAMKTRRNEDMNKMYKMKDVNVHMNVMYNMCTCYCCVL
jgi:hypothetical protein